jgi:deazaflavin-dependent oxidoreductase (nitroreductase family)
MELEALRTPRDDTPTRRAPLRVQLFGRILKFLLGHRVPLGPNRIVLIRGRKSGVLRPTPIAVLRVGGRMFVWAPWGEVNWVRNLRAARRATIMERSGQEDVTATELDAPQRVEFFRDILAPYARRIPLGFMFVRLIDGVDLKHPVEIAKDRRVFELHPIQVSGDGMDRL